MFCVRVFLDAKKGQSDASTSDYFTDIKYSLSTGAKIEIRYSAYLLEFYHHLIIFSYLGSKNRKFLS